MADKTNRRVIVSLTFATDESSSDMLTEVLKGLQRKHHGARFDAGVSNLEGASVCTYEMDSEYPDVRLSDLEQ